MMCSPDILMYNPFALIRDAYLYQDCIFAANFMSGERITKLMLKKKYIIIRSKFSILFS